MKTYIEKTQELSKSIIDLCQRQKLKIVLGESMTGGLLASELTAVENASKVLEESYVVYSEKAKKKVLNCKQETIDEFSVYSYEIIKEMILGLSSLSNADIKIAISGIAGPKTYYDLPIGTVFIGLEISGKLNIYHKTFKGDRRTIRYQTAIFVFNEIIKQIS